jgi:hypothetical protein
MVQNWDEELEASILAENFYLDLDRKDRIEAVQKVFNEAGDILKVGELNPSNQLRGYFYIETKNGRIGIAFTLTPERDPKVQKLQVVFQKK